MRGNARRLALERETGFEPATFCLGSRCSTPELLPLAVVGGVSVAQVWLRNAYAIVAYPKANNIPLCAFALEIAPDRRNRRVLVPRGRAAGQRCRRFGVAYHEAQRAQQRADAGYAEHIGDADGRGERTDYE